METCSVEYAPPSTTMTPDEGVFMEASISTGWERGDWSNRPGVVTVLAVFNAGRSAAVDVHVNVELSYSQSGSRGSVRVVSAETEVYLPLIPAQHEAYFGIRNALRVPLEVTPISARVGKQKVRVATGANIPISG
jgi:hypothetical protein